MSQELYLDIRFGVVAVKKGFVRREDILNAINIQLDEDFDIGHHRLMGQILVDGGLISIQQRHEVLEEMKRLREQQD
jgi:hypothetical protein